MYKTTEGSFGKQACMTLQFMAVSPFNNPWYSISSHLSAKAILFSNFIVIKRHNKNMYKTTEGSIW